MYATFFDIIKPFTIYQVCAAIRRRSRMLPYSGVSYRCSVHHNPLIFSDVSQGRSGIGENGIRTCIHSVYFTRLMQKTPTAMAIKYLLLCVRTFSIFVRALIGFPVGWLFWAFPTNLLMQKFPIAKYLAVNVCSLSRYIFSNPIMTSGFLADLLLGRASHGASSSEGLQGHDDSAHPLRRGRIYGRSCICSDHRAVVYA